MFNLYKITYNQLDSDESAECIYLFASIREANKYAKSHTPEGAVASISIYKQY